MSDLLVHHRDDAVRFSVRVQPRSTRDAVVGVHAGALKVKVRAPPVDGAANAALVKLLADRLGVPARDVRIVSGATTRAKVVEVRGVGVARVRSLGD